MRSERRGWNQSTTQATAQRDILDPVGLKTERVPIFRIVTDEERLQCC